MSICEIGAEALPNKGKSPQYHSDSEYESGAETPPLSLHRKFDFSKLCSCQDCNSKLARLKKFMRQLRIRMKKLEKRSSVVVTPLNRITYQCMDLATSVYWTKDMLDWLLDRSGISLTHGSGNLANDLEKLSAEMTNLLKENGLLVENTPDDEDGDLQNMREHRSLQREIDDGRFCYEQIQQREALLLLEMIEKIEKDHEDAKKAADAKNEPFDPSISESYIQEQIKLVKQLPVRELYENICKLAPEAGSLKSESDIFRRAAVDISNTMEDITWKQYEFWEKHHCTTNQDEVNPSLTSEGKEHDGLKELLESLCKQVDLFENQWITTYERLVSQDHKSKKQRTE